jgi:acyl dehydratase
MSAAVASIRPAVAQGETLDTCRYGPFDQQDVAAYAAASGDDNPLHVDPAIAAKAGLAGVPIHGMLIMGCFQSYLQAWRPDLRVVKLTAKFIRPVLVGEAFEIGGKVVRAGPDAPAMLRLSVKRAGGAGDLVCLAEAAVAP